MRLRHSFGRSTEVKHGQNGFTGAVARIRGIHSFGRSRENVRLRHSFGSSTEVKHGQNGFTECCGTNLRNTLLREECLKRAVWELLRMVGRSMEAGREE